MYYCSIWRLFVNVNRVVAHPGIWRDEHPKRKLLSPIEQINALLQGYTQALAIHRNEKVGEGVLTARQHGPVKGTLVRYASDCTVAVLRVTDK